MDGALPILADALQNQPQWSDLPILFVASGGLESPLAVQVMQELPNVLVLDRPVRIATLAGASRMALRIRDKQRQVRIFCKSGKGVSRSCARARSNSIGCSKTT